MATAIDITFPGNLAQVETAADMRAIPSMLIADGVLYIVEDLAGLFQFDANSFAVDDGTTVLKPNDRTILQAGRWTFKAEGLGRGPQGNPGGNVSSTGAFADLTGQVIPTGTDLVQTSGDTRSQAVRDDTLTDAYMAAHPLTTRKTQNLRRFRIDERTIDFKAMGAGRGNDDYPIYLEAVDYLQRFSTASPVSYLASSPRLRIPGGTYNSSEPLPVKQAIYLDGDAGVFEGGEATVFRCLKGGLSIDRTDTVGGVQVGTPTTSGEGSVVSGIVFRYIGTDAKGPNARPGVTIKGRSLLSRVATWDFPGDGFRINANGGGSGEDRGNANLFQLAYCQAYNSYHGFHARGADANAGTIVGCNAYQNASVGMFDESFLGNAWFGCHVAGSGGGLGNIRTMASFGGNQYYVKFGQEVAASTTQPGTNSAVWGYIQPGGAVPGLVAAWQAGMTWMWGAAYAAVDRNARATFFGCYREGGQPLSQIKWPSTAWGGFFGNDDDGIWAQGEQGYLGAQRFLASGSAGLAQDSHFWLNNDTGGTLSIDRMARDLIARSNGQDLFYISGIDSLRFAAKGQLLVPAIGTGNGSDLTLPHTGSPAVAPTGNVNFIGVAENRTNNKRTAANQPAGWTNVGTAGAPWVPYGAQA